jgi:hypothetical protein
MSTDPRCHEAVNDAGQVRIDRRLWHFDRRPDAAREPAPSMQVDVNMRHHWLQAIPDALQFEGMPPDA